MNQIIGEDKRVTQRAIEKSIHVIGGGLYGCLTAYHIQKAHPTYQVHLVEAADRLMTAFDSISLGGMMLNNGFHGLEIPRTQSLLQFFLDEVGIEFELKPNRRFLSIKGSLIPFEADFVQWPEDLKSFFKGSAPLSSASADDFWTFVTLEYKEFLSKIGARYSSHVEDIQNLLIPWFFPADYVLNSQDEGAVFRNAVRKGEINALYAFPKEHVFMILQSAMERILKKIGVNVHFSTKVKFSDHGIEYMNSDVRTLPSAKSADHIFFCASSAIMLKDVDTDLFKILIQNKRKLVNALLEVDYSNKKPCYFSEILCADDFCPPLARLSAPTEFGLDHTPEQFFLQAELFCFTEQDLEGLEKSLPGHVVRILNLEGDGRVRLVDMKVTRDVFFPTRRDLAAAERILAGWVGRCCPNLKMRSSFSPINMAKTWLWAQENAEMC